MGRDLESAANNNNFRLALGNVIKIGAQMACNTHQITPNVALCFIQVLKSREPAVFLHKCLNLFRYKEFGGGVLQTSINIPDQNA